MDRSGVWRLFGQLGLVGLITLLSCTAAPAPRTSSTPNIIVFLTDDMGLGDVRAYDASSTIPTPRMNQMASEGMRFTDAHSPAAVCTPSRYGLLTGRYPCRSTLSQTVLFSAYDSPLLSQEHETVASMLQRAGYHTAAFGKWHLGMSFTNKDGNGIAQAGVGSSKFSTRDVDFKQPILNGPRQHGFDYFFGLGSSINHGPYVFIENDRVRSIPTSFRKEKLVRKKPFREGWVAGNWDDSQQGHEVCNKALQFIRSHHQKNPQQPFFMYYAATSNHWPHVPPTKINQHPVKGQGGTDNNNPARNDMVVESDVILGELLDLLDELDLQSNTLVIVTSDNGADVGFYESIKGKKGSIYEGGHRVPFIVRWPQQVPANQRCDLPINQVDIYATLASITSTSLKPRAAEDSVSFLPLLTRSNATFQRPPMLLQGGFDKGLALREGRWKLIVRNGQAAELYDLAEDLKEEHNLISQKKDLVSKLFSTFQSLRNPTH